MPIPAFDSILNVLPPHLGDPRDPSHHSPYRCTMNEICQRFATSQRRIEILKGFLNLRARLFQLGVQGFQWLDGSFMEDIEVQESRDPNDVDVLTYVSVPADRSQLDLLVQSNTWLLDRNHLKSTFLSDHFLVPLSSDPKNLVGLTRYWYGLFSHRRDSVWKGMLQVELNDPNDDSAAMQTLGGAP